MTDQLIRQRHDHDHETHEIADYAGIELRPLGLPGDLETADHDEDHDGSPFFRKLTDLVSDHSTLSIIEYLTRRETSTWAVLVVSFSDDPTPSTDLTRYKKVFTSAGAGTMNMVDYFSDMSHGKLDLSATKVFGPYVLNRPRSDYVGNVYPQPAGKLNRNGVLDLAKATATAAGVNLSAYAGVVVCGTPLLDLCGWVGGGAALCDDNSLQPSLLGQEMGHGYGLNHSRITGSTADYQDPWDTMSTANAYMASHPTYGAIGPGLNATNMKMRGWLNDFRVHTVDTAHVADELITLRPLHARQLSGTLAIVVGGYTVELRTVKRWDAGIPRACVLVHRSDGDRSVLMTGTAGNADLVAGDTFKVGLKSGLFSEYVRIHVKSLDAAGEQAVVRVEYVPAYVPHVPQLNGSDIFGGVAVDGGGFVVINGHVHKVPPRGPARELVESLAGYLEAGDKPTDQVAALEAVVRRVGAAARDVEVVSHTPPGAEHLMGM